jgi:hypothetical protein
MTSAAPDRDERRDMAANVASRRAAQLRDELIVIVRLARLLAHDVLSAEAAVKHGRSDVARAEPPAFLRWWWRSQWLLPLRDSDDARIAHERVDVAEAGTYASITAKLVSIVGSRVATLRERIAIADVYSVGATATDDTYDDELDDAVDHAGVCDTLELALELRRAIDAAEIAATDPDADDASIARARRGLAYARVHLELVLASLIALRGPDDPTVVQLASIVRELRSPADAPDEQWRRSVAADRDRIAAVLADLERQLAR